MACSPRWRPTLPWRAKSSVKAFGAIGIADPATAGCSNAPPAPDRANIMEGAEMDNQTSPLLERVKLALEPVKRFFTGETAHLLPDAFVATTGNVPRFQLTIGELRSLASLCDELSTLPAEPAEEEVAQVICTSLHHPSLWGWLNSSARQPYFEAARALTALRSPTVSSGEGSPAEPEPPLSGEGSSYARADHAAASRSTEGSGTPEPHPIGRANLGIGQPSSGTLREALEKIAADRFGLSYEQKVALSLERRDIARDALQSAPAVAVPEELRPIRRWRHVARGSAYDELGTAELQAANGPVEEGALLIIYRGDDGKLWARRASEFGDGRFALLTPTKEQDDEPGDRP